MHITISGMNMLVTGDTRGYAEYRLFSAAAPYSDCVKSIDVILARRNATRLPVQCTVRIALVPSGQLRTSARGVQPTTAIDAAADRAGRRLRCRSDRRVSS